MTVPREQGRPPLVSVCIPTYNRRSLLEKTLETLKNQTLEDFELIVCDDCSTDGTFEFLCSLNWPNLRVLRNSSNLNLPGTMTRLFGEARGEYVGMQHDHDLYYPNFLERMVALMERHPTAGFGCSAFDTFDDEGEVIEPPSSWFYFYPNSELCDGEKLIEVLATRLDTPIPAMGTMFRREVVERAGGYRPDWHIAADEDLYRRVAQISDAAFSRERLFVMRPRPRERYRILGSWQAIYTLHDFRADTTRRYLKAGKLKKQFNIARLSLRRLQSLFGECASLSIRGQYKDLDGATNPDSIPTLPTGRPTLNWLERVAVKMWILFLRTLCWLAGSRVRRLSRTNRIEQPNHHTAGG
jgi:glycosyltransferase involved in cell wall biosynthesis